MSYNNPRESQPPTSGSVTPTDQQSHSSPTSYGDTPIHRFPSEYAVYHREEVSTSSMTTPEFGKKEPINDSDHGNSRRSNHDEHGDNRMSILGSNTSDDGNRSLRTLEDVREQVAERVAVRAIRKLTETDSTQTTVYLTLAKKNDAEFLRLVSVHLQRILPLKSYLIAVATTGVGETSIMVCGSSKEQVQRAALLSTAKFVGRVKPLSLSDLSKTVWIGSVRDVSWTSYDEAALWDVITKSAQNLVDPLVPPPGSLSITQILEAARTRLQRLAPQQAYDELHDSTVPMPVLLIDIRPAAQRQLHGAIPVLNATDVDGGFSAWQTAGLPVDLPKPGWI
jgi:hypothetical protein